MISFVPSYIKFFIKTSNMAERIISGTSTVLDNNFSKKTLIKLQSEVCSKLTCSLCPQYRWTSLKMYDEHLKSKKHLRRKFRKENEGVWFCEACKINLPNDEEWVKHLTGQRHDKAMKCLALKKIPTSKLITPQEIALLDKYWVEEESDDDNT